MKICTFNVNSIRARQQLIEEWLDYRGGDLDVLCFQEIKVVDELFPGEDFKRRGYECAVSGQKGYAGVAVCSRIKFDSVEAGWGETNWDEQKRVLSVRFPDFTLINLYAPHGGERGEDKYDYKLSWYGRLLEFLEARHSPGEPLMLAGDLNVTRDDRDVYSAEALYDTIGTMPEEREAFSRLLDWGLTDVFRSLNPETRMFTWWGYMGGAVWKDEGMRIDYVLCTESLAGRIRGAQVDMWPRKRRNPTPSDHAPLIVTLTGPD